MRQLVNEFRSATRATARRRECRSVHLLKDKEVGMAANARILEEALKLTAVERAELVDSLLSSLDEPDKEIDNLWAREAEDRIDAYDQGQIKAVTLDELLEKYR
jgi:putative addiction module component (TIGR02574 family)